DEDVVVAAQILRVAGEAFAAEVALRQAVALHHRPHRAVEDENARGEQRVELRADVTCHRWSLFAFFAAFASIARFAPTAINTVNGSPALRAPTPTRTLERPASLSMLRSSSSSKPRRRSPSFARTHASSCVRR